MKAVAAALTDMQEQIYLGGSGFLNTQPGRPVFIFCSIVALAWASAPKVMA
jgi:hypothetical protein